MSPAPRAGTPVWVAAATVGGLALVFLGEKVFPTIAVLRLVLTAAGATTVVALTALRWGVTGRTTGEQRKVERSLAVLSTCSAVAVALYWTTASGGERALRIVEWEPAARERYEAVVTVAWVMLLVGAVVPMLFAERALFPMRRSAAVEWRRVRSALVAGLTLALAAAYGSLFTFSASELDWKADFSYFRTARPSESTRKIARAATEPVDVQAFFPPLNPVGREVASYMRDVARASPAIHYETYDRLLAPEIARKASVFDDGAVVVARGGEHETLWFGVDLTAARPKLRSLDADFQKALVKVLHPARTAYLTVGHGELNERAATRQNEGRSARGVRQLLERQNYRVRDLGAATGLGSDVPADATLVVVLGPQESFLPEEIGALKRYAARGGHFFLCLDPQSRADLAPLADLAGLRFTATVLANDKVHLRRRFNDSDNTILATNRYSGHPSVATLSRIGSRPVFFEGAGILDHKQFDSARKFDFAVRALPDTFNDLNGNFRFDPPAEKREGYALAAATSWPAAGAKNKGDEARAFVVADVDAVSDAFLANEANALLVADAVRWLAGDESLAGEITTGKDVRIEHTKQQDLVWFYGTIFAVPALVLGAGLLYTRRSRRAKPRTRKAGTPPVTGGVTA